MSKDFSRSRRVGEQLQRDLALLIQNEIKDPRLGMVTVSAVEVSRDMAYAKVYIMMSGADDETKASLGILNKAAGFLRHTLSKSTNMRTMPKLQFYHDKTMEHGANLSALIEHAVTTDKEKAADRDEEQDKENE
ncbi:MAG: 30S ribosome-binding factor RbfA [Gammaproteobacteria bacterium]|nr:30S ribosome-binding factor RbfA [Gammaproteobacteria bacterium]MDH5593157.1 30S ribosome-binding factor RbfA [Gammaproteobacteria bacterium]MDH5614427.1 30S ribosome-binding factor RbfA [Gammaproteobacteria bacterium]